MPATVHVQYSISIGAPAALVWQQLTLPESYRRWAAAFGEGSHFEGSWEVGASMRFLSPTGDGMLSEIALLRAPEVLSIRHLGLVTGGLEDTTSDAVRAWAPAHETYHLTASPDGTRLVVEMDIPAEWEAHLNEMWPRALQLLKQLCERPHGQP